MKKAIIYPDHPLTKRKSAHLIADESGEVKASFYTVREVIEWLQAMEPESVELDIGGKRYDFRFAHPPFHKGQP